ncbi:MAPEG family protein [Vibrio nigripulchritudo]|uniref:MAPEG family protein n=1 Tax=Vibrio nigripulchritudo TaxID=28173 RepID=UPI002490DF41|nr:MAPEG family protein [Vibrio nigripulchritudo]BDU37598.1 hypothetical protein TUMSATVNIG2_20670 [Vibrio nigripulchritudo]BDU43318.1 hypothetical protein TUMSATVNIG3_21160 [Vibrio nigripulchritudo]
MIYLAEYQTTVLVVGLMGALMFIQLLIADVVGIIKKHKPGHTIASNHDDLLFRVARAHLNTNESIAIFILVTLFAVLTSASPYWVNLLASVYFGSRVAHMFCYYLNFKIARSVVFAVTALNLLGLFVVGLMAF